MLDVVAIVNILGQRNLQSSAPRSSGAVNKYLGVGTPEISRPTLNVNNTRQQHPQCVDDIKRPNHMIFICLICWAVHVGGTRDLALEIRLSPP